MKKISDFVISTPIFDVKMSMEDSSTKVNEYTFRNLQLQVSEKNIEPFWFVNQEGQWEQCRPDGILRTTPYSLGFVPDKYGWPESAMSITADLAMRLLRNQK